jgi:hypothetical protein
MYDEMHILWPEGTVLDFCIALELEPFADSHVVMSMEDPAFVRRVIQEGERRGIQHESIAARYYAGDDHVVLDPESESDSADEDFPEHHDHKPGSGRWRFTDVHRFKEVISSLAKTQTRSWLDVAKQFPGKTSKQCKYLYQKL